MGNTIGFKINDQDSIQLTTGETATLEIRIFRKDDWHPIDVNGLLPVLRIKRKGDILELPGSYHIPQAGIMRFQLSAQDCLSLPVEKNQSMELTLTASSRFIVVCLPRALNISPRILT